MHDHGGRRTPARPPRRRRRLHLAGLVAALALTLGVAACGGGKSNGVASLGGADQPTATTNASASGSGGYDLRQALVFTRCMRQHGYDMPDPQIEDNTVGVQLPNYQGQRAPKFQAAWQACRRYAPNGGQPERPSAQDRQQALAFARCMRQHGINLPDPQVTAEGIDQPPAPGMHRDDPRQKAAEQACSQRRGGGK
jgi:hypothetical protein